MTRRRKWLIAAAVLVIGLVVAGSRTGNRVVGELGGRQIVGTSSHALARASYSGSESSATVTLGSHSAVVTADSVTLDDGRVLAIPAATQRIELHESGDALRVAFDGEPAP